MLSAINNQWLNGYNMTAISGVALPAASLILRRPNSSGSERYRCGGDNAHLTLI